MAYSSKRTVPFFDPGRAAQGTRVRAVSGEMYTAVVPAGTFA